MVQRPFAIDARCKYIKSKKKASIANGALVVFQFSMTPSLLSNLFHCSYTIIVHIYIFFFPFIFNVFKYICFYFYIRCEALKPVMVWTSLLFFILCVTSYFVFFYWVAWICARTSGTLLIFYIRKYGTMLRTALHWTTVLEYRTGAIRCPKREN